MAGLVGVVGTVSSGRAAESGALAAVDGFSSTDKDLGHKSDLETPVLAPIRHLAGLSIRENIEDFRMKLSSQNTDLRGFVAEPLQGPLVRQRLEEVLRQSAKDSGRFGLVMPLLDEKFFAAELSSEERQRLAREYGTDGFVETSLTFFPDHVSVGLRILATADARILAHQSMVLAPLPTESQIYSGFLALWARLGQATGHLSAISWQSGDLVTVDIGKPELQVGQKLIAGHVMAQRVHPRTGEVLSFRREQACELVVLEVNDTSSLAKVTSVKLSTGRLSHESGLKGLLVWSKQESDEDLARLRVANSQASGVANAGFDFADFEQNAAKLADATYPNDKDMPAPANGKAPTAASAPPAPKAPPGEKRSAPDVSGVLENGGTDPETLQLDPLATDDASGADSGTTLGGGSLDRPWSEAMSDPAHWRRLPFILGAGQSWGILDTAPCANEPCNRYSGFPSSVFNLIQASARYQVTRDAGLSFEGRFSNYPRGDVEGYEIGGRALSVHTLSHTGREQFVVYGGPDLRIGNAQTVLVDRSLMALTIRSGAGYAFGTPFGKWQGRADLSFLDLLGGKFYLDANITAGSLPMLPSELGFFLNFRDSPKDWAQVEWGAQWTFRSGL